MQIYSPITPTANTKSSGLLGYYFSDDSHSVLSYVTESHTGELAVNLPETIKSIYWCGYLQPTQSGEYHFSTSDPAHTRITVNGKSVPGAASDNPSIPLNADTLYSIEIWYVRQPEQRNVWLRWQSGALVSSALVEMDYIPNACLVLPNAQESAPVLLQTNARVVRSAISTPLMADGKFSSPVPDVMQKGIPDEWEVNGYTVEYTPKNKGGVKKIVKWEDAQHKDKPVYTGGPNYVKYTSNPEVLSTVGDPYSDYDKVMGKCGDDVSPRVNHPWIAAYPEVTLEVAAFSIHEKDDKGNSTGRGESKYRSTKKTTGTVSEMKHGWSVSATASAGKGTGLSGSITIGASGEYGTSTYDLTEQESGSNESSEAGSSISYDTSSRAATYASVRFVNVGTASIYQCKPTINMRLTPGEVGGVKYDYDDITTIDPISNPGQVASDIVYGGIFPSADATVMMYQTNDKSSSGIMLNDAQYQQFLALQNFETSISSFVGSYLLKTKDNKADYRPWVEYKNAIKARCVKVTWMVPAAPNRGKGRYKGYNQQIVRYIYAKDNNLTLENVLNLTSELKYVDGKYTFKASRSMNGIESTFYELAFQVNTRRDLDSGIEDYYKKAVGADKESWTFDKLSKIALIPGSEITLSPKGYTTLDLGNETLGFCYGDDANFLYGAQRIKRPDINGIESKETYLSFFDKDGVLFTQTGWCSSTVTNTEVQTEKKGKKEVRYYIRKEIRSLYYNGERIKKDGKDIGFHLMSGLKENFALTEDGVLRTGWLWLAEERKLSKLYGHVNYENKKQKQVDEFGEVSYKDVTIEVMKEGVSGYFYDGFRKINGYKYYFNSNEKYKAVRGFKEINGNLYYFKDERFDKNQRGGNKIPENYPMGAMIEPVSGHLFYVGGKCYRVQHDGSLTRGFLEWEKSLGYHFDKKTGEYLFHTDIYKKGLVYPWLKGWDINGPIRSRFVRDSDGGEYYFNLDGWCWLGWITCPVHSKYYSFSNLWNQPYGLLSTGWASFSDDGSKWYYFGTGNDGTVLPKHAMATGVIRLGNSQYLLGADGKALQNEKYSGYFEYGNGIPRLRAWFYTGDKGVIKKALNYYRDRAVYLA